MVKFSELYASAVLHKGGEAQVEGNLPQETAAQALIAQPDSEYLSQMSRRIFRAGLRHAMVDAKWPAFEQAFFGFDTMDVAMMSDEDLELQMQNKAIIRHFGKIKSVRANALFVRDISAEYGSFGRFLADWPSDNIVELWSLLKKRATQMGGQSGARFLRMVGKDTFLLTQDVVAVLVAQGVVTKEPTAKRDLAAVQQVFNQWQAESGRSLSEISRIVSFTCNA